MNPLAKISEKYDADIISFSAGVSDENYESLIKAVQSISGKAPNVILLLTTFGGNPHAAFKIARFLSKNYKSIIVFVIGYCKSAGTIIALGADLIVMFPTGELGPIDAQLFKPDEKEFDSALIQFETFKSIELFIDDFFKEQLRYYQQIEGYSIKNSIEIARSVTEIMFAPIISQIEPANIVRTQRAINLARDYALRICRTKNHKDKKVLIELLIESYTDHRFVIDYQEAKELFGQNNDGKEIISEPSDEEMQIPDSILNLHKNPNRDHVEVLFCKFASIEQAEDTTKH